MKTIEQLEQEYDQYQRKTEDVKTLKDFFSHIKHGIEDTKEYQKEYRVEIRENDRWKLAGKIRNFFYFVFAEEDVDFYDMDSDIMQQCILFTQHLGDFYQRIRNVASQENFLELVRLVDFSADCHNAQMDYYEYKRDQLELSMMGLQLYHGRFEDNSEPFYEFMDKKIKEFELEKHPKDVSVFIKKKELR